MNKSKTSFTVVLIFAAWLLILAPCPGAAKVFTDDDLKKFRPNTPDKTSEQEVKQNKTDSPAPHPKPAEEPAKPISKNFNFYYDGAFVGVTITTMPGEKKINLDFQIRSKSIYICYRDLNITQKGRTLSFGTAADGDDTAKFIPAAGWEGCGVSYSGVTRTAVVGPVPEWFNFKESFNFNFRGRILTIDQP